MNLPFLRNQILLALAGTTVLLGTGPVLGAGFQLNETSASGLGNVFAGGAAAAEDASTLWSNPAGLSRLGQPQVAGVLHLITPSIRFRRSAAAADAVFQSSNGDGGDAGGLNVVPNLYLAWPLNRDVVLGLGINSPWGLVTDYDAGWIGRFQADKSDIMTLNVNPALSYKLAPDWSLGVGLNWQRMVAEFSNQVNYSAALVSAAPLANRAAVAQVVQGLGLESAARIKGSDNAWGWNVGLLWAPDAGQRVGLSYRSVVRYQLSGSAHFDNPAAPAAVAALAAGVNALALYDTTIRADVKMPPVANLSYFRQLSPQWDVMADLQWTGWSTIETLRFVRSNGTDLQNTPEHFKDSWKLAVGANWRLGGPWTLKGGLAYDQTPVRDAYRTPRLPDSDRAWLSVGVQYQAGPALRLDLGGAYLRSQRATIQDDGRAGGNALLDGEYRSHTTILSGQATYSF